jgi:hypothetical protein
MARRPADREFCEEFAAKLRPAIVGMTKKTAAATLGVSRQMLDVYLNAKSTPGSDVVLRAMKAWNFTLKYRGRELSSSQWTRPTVVEIQGAAEQLFLPLRDAIQSLDEGDLRVRIAKREPDRIDLQVSIRFAG